MADTTVPAPTQFNQNGTPPLSYVVAMMLGMPHEDILQGLRNGSVAPPPGAPPGWLPPWAAGDANASEVGGSTPVDTGHAGSAAHSGIDRAAVQRWFGQLDPALSPQAFEDIWQNAGADDTARADALFGYLRRTLLAADADVPAPSAAQANADSATSAAAALTSYLADPAHRAHVVDLAGKDGAEIARLAGTDIGYRYALAHLDSLALTGNRALFSSANLDGALDRFDPDTGERNLTDAWLADRAKFLAWKMRLDGGDEAKIGGTDEWVFVDRTLRDSSGNPMRLQIAAADGAKRTNQLVFGADTANGEMLKGGTGTDRIYGGSGDDVIRGNAGDDHLEGGRGDDLVIGGSGNDELVGGRGDDELDGGAGKDLLQGGSGDDTLTGGAGADRMEGGDGHDTYVLAPGEGTDAIADSDGDGEVQFDGAALAGATASTGGRYVSADGRAVYSFDGDVNESGTLTISFYANANPGASDSPVSSVRIENWKNGDLGIRLGSDASAGNGATTDGAGADNGPSTDGGAQPPSTDVPPTNAVAPTEAPPPSEIPTAGGEAVGSGASDTDTSAATENATMDAGGESAPTDNAATAAAGASDGTATFDAIAPDLAAVPGAGAIAGVHSVAVLLNPEIVGRAVQSFAGVPEAPDITAAVHAAGTATVGVTPQDVSNAMLDFHDAGDLAHDQAGSEPLPSPLPTLVDTAHTGGFGGRVSTAGATIGKGSGQRG